MFHKISSRCICTSVIYFYCLFLVLFTLFSCPVLCFCYFKKYFTINMGSESKTSVSVIVPDLVTMSYSPNLVPYPSTVAPYLCIVAPVLLPPPDTVAIAPVPTFDPPPPPQDPVAFVPASNPPMPMPPTKANVYKSRMKNGADSMYYTCSVEASFAGKTRRIKV